MILLNLKTLNIILGILTVWNFLDVEQKGIAGTLSVTLQPVCGTLCRTHSDNARLKPVQIPDRPKEWTRLQLFCVCPVGSADMLAGQVQY
ncbi:hypothetical protein DPMN_042812 [Dreissena polymorpha]|uniref:Secreted protein n=1 Tax=Dreissena polymorpha TaxID=45954 RepID=A0A9D4D1P7_DREPO|nr:hypothetical protein DPMN_042812 [Dreissena polymorpha]